MAAYPERSLRADDRLAGLEPLFPKPLNHRNYHERITMKLPCSRPPHHGNDHEQITMKLPWINHGRARLSDG